MTTVLESAAKPTRVLGGVLAMTLDALVILCTRRFSWREAVQQAWFIARVSLVPTLLVMLGFTLLVIFEVNLLLKDLGALDLAGGVAGIASIQQIGPFVTVVVVAGAGGTAMCADLAARTIREEIAAMQVLGIDPIQRLVGPRIVAASRIGSTIRNRDQASHGRTAPSWPRRRPGRHRSRTAATSPAR